MRYLNTLLMFIWKSIGVLFGIGVLLLIAFIIIGTVQEVKERKNGKR